MAFDLLKRLAAAASEKQDEKKKKKQEKPKARNTSVLNRAVQARAESRTRQSELLMEMKKSRGKK